MPVVSKIELEGIEEVDDSGQIPNARNIKRQSTVKLLEEELD